MKSVLFLCLTLAGVFAFTAPYLNPVDVAMRTANCIPSTEIVVATTDQQVATTDQQEVHAVVVDMPERASLEHASPDTWGTLPTFDPLDEEFPTKPVLQVAMN
jgi:hypothetical protein